MHPYCIRKTRRLWQKPCNSSWIFSRRNAHNQRRPRSGNDTAHRHRGHRDSSEIDGRPAGPRPASRTARPLRVSAKDSPLPPMTTSQGLRLQSFPNTRSGLYEGHSLPNCLRLRPAYGRAMARHPVKRRSRSDSSEPKPNARSRIKRNGISVFSSPAYRNSLWPASTRPPYPAPGSDQGLADGRKPPWAARYLKRRTSRALARGAAARQAMTPALPSYYPVWRSYFCYNGKSVCLNSCFEC